MKQIRILLITALVVVSITTLAAANGFENLKKAASAGDAQAQNRLGMIYGQGEWVPQDYAQARKWFMKAAAQGYAGAFYNLGVIYDQGMGVSKDYTKARRWYKLAASQGDAN